MNKDTSQTTKERKPFDFKDYMFDVMGVGKRMLDYSMYGQPGAQFYHKHIGQPFEDFVYDFLSWKASPKKHDYNITDYYRPDKSGFIAPTKDMYSKEQEAYKLLIELDEQMASGKPINKIPKTIDAETFRIMSSIHGQPRKSFGSFRRTEGIPSMIPSHLKEYVSNYRSHKAYAHKSLEELVKMAKKQYDADIQAKRGALGLDATDDRDEPVVDLSDMIDKFGELVTSAENEEEEPVIDIYNVLGLGEDFKEQQTKINTFIETFGNLLEPSISTDTSTTVDTITDDTEDNKPQEVEEETPVKKDTKATDLATDVSLALALAAGQFSDSIAGMFGKTTNVAQTPLLLKESLEKRRLAKEQMDFEREKLETETKLKEDQISIEREKLETETKLKEDQISIEREKLELATTAQERAQLLDYYNMLNTQQVQKFNEASTMYKLGIEEKLAYAQLASLAGEQVKDKRNSLKYLYEIYNKTFAEIAAAIDQANVVRNADNSYTATFAKAGQGKEVAAKTIGALTKQYGEGVLAIDSDMLNVFIEQIMNFAIEAKTYTISPDGKVTYTTQEQLDATKKMSEKKTKKTKKKRDSSTESTPKLKDY